MDRRTDKKILWKCEFSRKFQCDGPLHTDLSNKFIGDQENPTDDRRSGPIRQYYHRLRTEPQQNQTNSHNILTQVNIGVQDEVRLKITNNDNLKRNIRCWRQQAHAAPVPSSIDFPVVPDSYHRTTCDIILLRKDIGPTSNRLLRFFTNEQRNIMENSTVNIHEISFNYTTSLFSRTSSSMERLGLF